jgi:hypothetical protein
MISVVARRSKLEENINFIIYKKSMKNKIYKDYLSFSQEVRRNHIEIKSGLIFPSKINLQSLLHGALL